jgi:hypothetical protein
MQENEMKELEEMVEDIYKKCGERISIEAAKIISDQFHKDFEEEVVKILKKQSRAFKRGPKLKEDGKRYIKMLEKHIKELCVPFDRYADKEENTLYKYSKDKLQYILCDMGLYSVNIPLAYSNVYRDLLNTIVEFYSDYNFEDVCYSHAIWNE